MFIPSVRELKSDAARAMGRAREPKKVILAYALITVAIAAVLTVLNAFLSNQIEGTGGLANFGIRSILSTAQNALPVLQSVVLMCLEFGYFHAILRLSRGQYADHTDLKVGFHRFGAILRLSFLQYSLLLVVVTMLFYLSMQIFLLTPLAAPLVELLTPIAEAGVDAATMLDEATLNVAFKEMIPLFILYGVLCCAVLIPMSYRLRMATYILLDDPQGKAMRAVRTSFRIMRRNGIRLFKLDFSFWWYHLLVLLASLVSYADMLLPMMGIQLPINETISFYLFYFIYLAMLFAIYYFLRNGVEITYAKAYDAIRDKPVDNGVVLGNIFDM